MNPVDCLFSYKRLKDPVKKRRDHRDRRILLIGATEEVVAPTDGIFDDNIKHPSVTEGSLVARVIGGMHYEKEIIYSSGNYLRDEFKIEGYLFGKQSEGSEPACVGAMRVPVYIS